jgi:hypothetical protein
MTSIVICCPNGLADYTVVSTPEGVPIRGITAVDVRIRAGGLVEAILRFEGVELDLTAEQVTTRREPAFWRLWRRLYLGRASA